MGRDRLRRGCSLEVIFEEDSDFCSNLDSLDPLPHFRRANRGDSYSIDTFFSEHSSNYPHLERPTLDRNTVFKSLDGYLDFRDMDSSFVEWDEFSSESSLRSDRTLSFLSQEHMSDSSPSTLSGRRSRVSRRQIVEASWVMDEEHDSTTPTIESFDDETEEKHLDFDLDVEDSSALLTEETYAAVDQFDEQHSFSVPLISSRTAKSNNTRPGPGPAPTNKFSWNSSRDGSLKSGESPSYANFPPGNSHQTSKAENNSGGMGHVSSSTDVKRVRAIFENSSASSSEDETNFSRKFNKGNNASCKRLKESNSNSNSLTSSGNPSMRSAYSHLSLNQMDRSDFADLLVNDKVIIEDSPDIYQMFRQHRHRDNLGGSGSKVSSFSSPFSRNSTLRRSKSVGAGIHQMNEDENMISMNNPSSSTEDMNGKDRPCILAEEMPARDTVKNVRTVFEQMYQKSRAGGNKEGNSRESSAPSNHINNNKSLSSIRSNPTSKILRSESMRTDFNGRADPVVNTKPIILATTLKKTQEISKVFESKATAKVQAQAQVPKPTPTTAIPKTKASNGLSKVWPSVNVVNASQRQQPPPPIHETTEEESNSLHSLASSTTADDLEDRKQISPDVLNRIRSCGTTTTYFGGEIVAKTIQNRKLLLAPRKNSREETSLIHHHEFEISSSETLFPTEEIFFSARPNQSTTPEKSRTPNPPTPTPRRPFDLQFNSLITSSTVDTTPRIISVLPKSQSNSPTKSNSPVGSLMEGRNSPEGCESQREWINDPAADVGLEMSPDIMKPEDSNNNSIKHEDNVKSNKFSQAAEGAWF